jgi:uncharacterized iron-regulated membrane protein
MSLKKSGIVLLAASVGILLFVACSSWLQRRPATRSAHDRKLRNLSDRAVQARHAD